MKNVDQFTIDGVHSKCDCIQAIISKSIRAPNSITFALDKPSGFGIICVPETKQHKKVNISIFNVFTFFLENKKEVDYKRKKHKIYIIKKRKKILKNGFPQS